MHLELMTSHELISNILLILPNLVLPPLECWTGVKPTHADTALSLRALEIAENGNENMMFLEE